ncbi:MAG: hypothetical protein OEQ39_04515 [Gammaproteobacteria bacterium]|nr:hypothetical protein [Gammaproteobacteria bacterium]
MNDIDHLAREARWPYRVVVKMDGEIMGSDSGIPCRSLVDAEALAAKYERRGPRITAQILPA